MRRLIAALCAITLCAPLPAQTFRGAPRPGFRSGFRVLGAACSPFSYTGTPLYQSLALTDSWTPGANTLTTNVAFSPACATTGAALIENTATSAHTAQKTVDVAITAAVHTLTIFYKPVGARTLGLELVDSTFGSGSHADVSGACAVTNQYTYGTKFSAETATTSLVNGWCKVALATTYASSDTEFTVFVSNTNAGSTNYAGDGVSGMNLWGVDFR